MSFRPQALSPRPAARLAIRALALCALLAIARSAYDVEGIWLVCQGAGCPDAAGFSIEPSARRITISRCRTTDFYQHFKGSMDLGAGAEDTIRGCEAFDTSSFAGNSDVVNLDDRKRWRVVGNYVHDYGNQGVSFGMASKAARPRA